MVFDFKTYKDLPCEIEVFRVNGVRAELDDFCILVVDQSQGCFCNIRGIYPFSPKDSVLNKYKISHEEYQEILSRIESSFDYGHCSWCK